MITPKVKSRMIIPHSKKCFVKGNPNPWSGLITGSYWGNFVGNEKAKSRNHIWHKVSCNDPNCPAIKAVHYSILIEA